MSPPPLPVVPLLLVPLVLLPPVPDVVPAPPAPPLPVPVDELQAAAIVPRAMRNNDARCVRDVPNIMMSLPWRA
ncbi:Hypothetical protein A7982_10079 [Minicystis rosea]|nr:Hypothetical protein A7982_10079 [Minicystis rosea]